MPFHLPGLINPSASFRARLVIVVGLISLVTILLLSWLVSTIAASQVRKDKGTLMAEVAHQMMETLDRGIFERQREIAIIASMDVIRDPRTPLAQKRKQLEQLQASYQNYAWIGIADAKGDILVGTGGLLEGKSVAQRSWFVNGAKGPAVGDVHDAFLLAKLLPRPLYDYLPLRLLDISAPILDEHGRLLGVICGHLSWDWSFQVRNEILEPLGQDFKADILVLGRENQLLMGTPKLHRLARDFSLPSTEAAAASRQGFVVETWPDGVDYLTGYAASHGYANYKGLGWKVLVRQEADRAFDTATGLGLATFMVGMFIGGLFLPVLWIVAGHLTRPMRSIASVADRIRSGHEEEHIPVYPGDDEIAVLSQSLAQLVDNMETQKHQLIENNQDLQLAAQVFASSTEGILIADADLRILSVNQAFSSITGYSPEEVIGQTPSLLASGKHNAAFYQAMWSAIHKTGRWQGEIYNRRKDGSVYPEWLIITSVRDAAGRISNYIGIFTDISERKTTEERILHLAKHDVLTDLPNRVFFLEEVEQAIAQAQAGNRKAAVLFVDLDRFKNINDSLGHHLGDLLLKEAARRFDGVVGKAGFLARWGGDEFVVLIRDLSTEEQVMALGYRISQALGEPFDIAGHHLSITSSIGIAIYPDHGTDLITLIRNADTAMFHAKAHGRDNIAFFTQDMNERANERLRLENDLRRAIGQNQLYLVYQPQVELATGRLVGVEALLRWQHPELGPIAPDKFIPVAEDTGLIEAIGEWALRTACRQQRQWELHYDLPLRMAVNLSPVQFQQSEIVALVHEVIAETGMNPEYLELEITEGVLLGSDEQIKIDLCQLSLSGIQIALDDFGTGYSSLRYLSQLDIHKLKIDRTFIHNLTEGGPNASIVAAIIAMAQNLGITLLAEGIETPEVADLLARMGCQEGQGYLYHRPLPAAEIESLLAEEITKHTLSKLMK
ncbi:PAS domain S-box-containing protein/diguanylate cyclase (GGDEF)-like protein [Sulfuritortus calidifontis]|uniref:PAS domain S-box-containing protein/diguanylate cyclase (GGDEF)-like protein n=1 Tax=Sulfuritortus calidifontis TaxID=1914471 RepID=A0A4R3JWV2_9PROT|nr:EAL domain-containing protein [Sulfuritortus calidifontis]TCS72680.1 PAS domain S-box-containing protein/diguanylate cyclase (GGDEF)-like protein [Sulfuritortus calidifontis]